MSKYKELADAMRLGAALRPQAYSTFFTRIIRTPGAPRIVGESCALGAAYEGATGTTPHLKFADVEKLFPVLVESVAMCPVCAETEEETTDLLINVIAELNDTHHWTREAIADWLCSPGVTWVPQ